jgi:hypothetical protein
VEAIAPGPAAREPRDLAIAGTDDLTMIVYQPDAGSSDAEKLALLGSTSVPAAGPDHDLSRRS